MPETHPHLLPHRTHLPIFIPSATVLPPTSLETAGFLLYLKQSHEILSIFKIPPALITLHTHCNHLGLGPSFILGITDPPRNKHLLGRVVCQKHYGRFSKPHCRLQTQRYWFRKHAEEPKNSATPRPRPQVILDHSLGSKLLNLKAAYPLSQFI